LQIQDICKVLELPNLPESSLATVAAEISSFKEMLPLSHAAVLAEHCLLQKVNIHYSLVLSTYLHTHTYTHTHTHMPFS